MKRNTWRIYGDSSYVTGRRFGQRLAFARSTVDVLIQGILAYEPMAYLPLNDPAGSTTARDVTGNGFTGTVSGAVNFGSAGLTAYGETAALFLGGSIQTTANIPLSPFTVINMRKQSATVIGVQSFCWEYYDGSNGITMYIRSGVNDGVVNEFHLNGSGTYGGQVTGSNNTNTHLDALVYDGIGALNYVDGSPGQPALPVAFGQPATNFSIAGQPVAQSYSGSIAHVAIFNRALTPEEIAGIYALVTATPSTVANCSMDASIGPLNNSDRGAVMGFESTRPTPNEYYWYQENIPPGGTQVSGSGGLLVNQNILLSQGSGQYGIMLIPPHSATIKTNGGFPPPQNSLLFLRFT